MVNKYIDDLNAHVKFTPCQIELIKKILDSHFTLAEICGIEDFLTFLKCQTNLTYKEYIK